MVNIKWFITAEHEKQLNAPPSSVRAQMCRYDCSNIICCEQKTIKRKQVTPILKQIMAFSYQNEYN